MSQLQKAKQRLTFRKSTTQSPDQLSQRKQFIKTSSIPKLNAQWMDRNFGYPQECREIDNNNQRSLSQIQVRDQNLLVHYPGFRESGDLSPVSPAFSKTQMVGLFRGQSYDAMSEHVPKINIIDTKGRSKRATDYSRVPSHAENNDVSFTEQERSVYNESPEKVIRNTVHNDKMTLIIAKSPQRRAISPFKPRQCMLETVETQIMDLKSTSSAFTDDMFPPRFTTIFNKKYMYLEEGLKLQRISKIYEGTDLRLIRFCQPSLIVAGKFTSPALLSALIILSEDPTRVLNILGNQQYNEHGIYYSHICKDGVWRYIVIDDYLPVKILGKRSLLFTHTLPRNNTTQFWPSIIQKALSKIFGTYQDIFLTSPLGIKDLFRNLTGYPVSQYLINKDFRSYLVIIDAAIKKKQIVVLQQIPEEFYQTAHLKGLDYHMSYQVIQVKKTYVVLRNLNQRDLVTKLTFQEVLVFCRLLIFRAEPGYVYISKNLRHKKRYYSKIRITIPKPTKCYLDIWQNSELYYKNHIGSQISYHRSPYRIHLQAQKPDSPTSNYDSQQSQEFLSESGKQINLGKGIYYLNIHLCQEREQDFVISYYGDTDVQICRVKNLELWGNDCFCQ